MHRTCRHRPRCRRRLARCGKQGIWVIRPNFKGAKTLRYPNAERKLQITPDDWVLFDVPLLLTLRDKMWVRAISRALVEQFKRSSYTEMPYCKNFVAGGEMEFHSAFYAYAWAFTYWLNKNHPVGRIHSPLHRPDRAAGNEVRLGQRLALVRSAAVEDEMKWIVIGLLSFAKVGKHTVTVSFIDGDGAKASLSDIRIRPME
jgi:hypothetical protein